MINALAAQGVTPVTCFTGVVVQAQQCAGLLTSALTTSSLTGLNAGQAAINGYLVDQFETNGGLFNYKTREYLFSARLDHRFSEANSINRSNYQADLGAASGASINIVSKSGTNDLHGSLFGFFRNDALDARDPFAFSQALAPGEVFDPAAPPSTGSPIKNSLQRYQFGANAGFPIQKDKTFAFVAFEGLRQNAENAVPLLTDTNIFLTTTPQNAVFGALAALPGNPVVPCINNPNGTVTSLPAQTCAFGLSTLLTVNPNPNALQQLFITPGQAALNSYLINQFESNGGLFPYNTDNYLASGRLDHRFDEANNVSLTYRYGHDLEENPDVQSLTGFSAGSSIHNYDNNIQGAGTTLSVPEIKMSYGSSLTTIIST